MEGDVFNGLKNLKNVLLLSNDCIDHNFENPMNIAELQKTLDDKCGKKNLPVYFIIFGIFVIVLICGVIILLVWKFYLKKRPEVLSTVFNQAVKAAIKAKENDAEADEVSDHSKGTIDTKVENKAEDDEVDSNSDHITIEIEGEHDEVTDRPTFEVDGEDGGGEVADQPENEVSVEDGEVTD
jgi:hypothetical protein